MLCQVQAKTSEALADSAFMLLGALICLMRYAATCCKEPMEKPEQREGSPGTRWRKKGPTIQHSSQPICLDVPATQHSGAGFWLCLPPVPFQSLVLRTRALRAFSIPRHSTRGSLAQGFLSQVDELSWMSQPSRAPRWLQPQAAEEPPSRSQSTHRITGQRGIDKFE